jgi:hypothetical protein
MEEDDMGEPCRAHGEVINANEIVAGKPEGK